MNTLINALINHLQEQGHNAYRDSMLQATITIKTDHQIAYINLKGPHTLHLTNHLNSKHHFNLKNLNDPNYLPHLLNLLKTHLTPTTSTQPQPTHQPPQEPPPPQQEHAAPQHHPTTTPD
jgi:hypothetical protein